MDACLNRSAWAHTKTTSMHTQPIWMQAWTDTHSQKHTVAADRLFSFPNHSHFYNNPFMQVMAAFSMHQHNKQYILTHVYTHRFLAIAHECPSEMEAWRTGYHFQRGPIGPCSLRPTGYVCVMMRRRRWSRGALITCVLLLPREAQRSPPPRG